MQIQQLQYFVTVANFLNFRMAAEALFVSQPLLSRQISNLEAELGQTLFIRNTRTVKLTSAGQMLYREASTLLKDISILEHSIKNFSPSNPIEGSMNIGLEDGFDRHLATESVFNIRQKYPHIHISLNRYSFLDLSKKLNDKTIDMAFMVFPDKKFASSKLDCSIIRKEPQVMIASSKKIKRHNQIMEYIQIAENDCLFLLDQNPKFINNCISICTQLQIAAEFRYVTDIYEMLFSIESGYGTAILPKSVFTTIDNRGLIMSEDLGTNCDLCFAAVWNKESIPNLGHLLLHEIQTNKPNCISCPTTWCYMHKRSSLM